MEKEIRQCEIYLKTYAYGLTKHQEEAADLYQDTLLRIVQNKDKFDPGSNFKAWASKIMYNKFVNAYHKKVNRKTNNCQFTDQQLDAFGPITYNKGEDNIAYHELVRLIESLPESYKLPFWLHYEGYRYQEIAKQMDWPMDKVKVRIFHARKRLQRLIERTTQSGTLKYHRSLREEFTTRH